jgi:glycosyltransferase involved in cell wall biosynthesis
MSKDSVVDVTIGLAAYQCAATLAQALDSLLAQTYPGFTIVVSDNCSPDGAGEICARYAAQDSRVRHATRATTVSAAENYRFLLQEARTPFFMWAAADDLWAPGFLEANRAFLIANPDYVLSQSRALFTSAGMPTRLAIGTSALCGSQPRNIARFFRNPSDNSRFYGLWRTEQAQQSYPDAIVYGFDWFLSGATLVHGKHHELSDIGMLRDETPAPHYGEAVTRYGDGFLSRFFPVFALTRQIAVDRRIPLSLGLIWSLLQLNLSISLRFGTLRLYSFLQKHSASSKEAPGFSSRLAAVIASVFAPGMRERWQARIAQARKSSGLRKHDAQSLFRSRITHGWQSQRTSNPQSSGPDASIVVIAQDALDDTLTALHHIALAVEGAATEVIIVDNASVDATGVLLTGRADLAYVRLPTRRSFDEVVSAGTSMASTDRIIVIEPTAWLDCSSVDEFQTSLAQVQTSEHPICLHMLGGIGLSKMSAPT